MRQWFSPDWVSAYGALANCAICSQKFDETRQIIQLARHGNWTITDYTVTFMLLHFLALMPDPWQNSYSGLQLTPATKTLVSCWHPTRRHTPVIFGKRAN